jgi:hypothetical protein
MNHTQLTEDYIKANDLSSLEAKIVRSICAWNRDNLTDDGLEGVVTRYLEILKCKPECTKKNKTASSAREVETLEEATNTKSAGAAEAAESTETSTTTRCTETTESNALSILKREAKELRYMATALEYRVKSVIAENQLHTKK